MNLEKFTVTLVPREEQAAGLRPDYTVEAEYGDSCVEGKILTLAHHGSRSHNPAPCNWEVEPGDGGSILISHIDLDTVGGILAITGDKIDDPEFWKGAEHIDVYGPHHIHDLSPEVRDQLNAVEAWSESRENGRFENPADVKAIIMEYAGFLEKVLRRDHPEHLQVLENGREWERAATQEIEQRCVFENGMVRGFRTDGPFCAAAYYSPARREIIPCTVSFHEKFKSVTVAFADGGREKGGALSAKEIVQELWGPLAGGRDGIAGSPRGREMTPDDFYRCIDLCTQKITEYEANRGGE